MPVLGVVPREELAAEVLRLLDAAEAAGDATGERVDSLANADGYHHHALGWARRCGMSLGSRDASYRVERATQDVALAGRRDGVHALRQHELLPCEA